MLDLALCVSVNKIQGEIVPSCSDSAPAGGRPSHQNAASVWRNSKQTVAAVNVWAKEGFELPRWRSNKHIFVNTLKMFKTAT